MTDRVFVSNLCLHGHHGLFPEETRLGQKFYIDIECAVDLAPAGLSDDYEKAVGYDTLCDIATAVSAAGPYKLIETLGHRIAEAVLARFYIITEVVVRVRKPSAPMAAMFDNVGVEIRRRRRRRIGLSLGSNVGNKIANIETALSLLRTENVVEFDGISKFYRTAPWGNEDQDWFVNVCAIGWTTMTPQDVLKAFKRIEFHVGRVPTVRWGPRVIDIDILFIDDIEADGPELTLPHRDMFNRAFVLVPLNEIAPDLSIGGRVIHAEVERMALKAGEVEPLAE
ncbi:2-amino-4-hydroxy-6-hydroxymethyldihydropteridine diphosphokinase [Allorhizobium borbori]|uniref:Bifunctional folate synthesis protein n=1 Tax=Allorhizobium borbori TaxID=485907 RepID=A0A7W6K5L2_9HYPH|nr:2-amino-4-hydroxy-6-hydroxymethyldihydropteridine diphosphokinase [Allorhizobium borbori]MBB4105615.1 dihydroneopterin aldolase/2-amino-4-hydroxy-6-hydroxymethyldihydropteridine diphosphokinase [Allorhizobium borbori]PZU19195.1 MAG: folate biosynthesis protein [Shinella sp.]